MLKNIEYTQINKQRIVISLFFLPLVCLLALFTMGLYFQFTEAGNHLGPLENLLLGPLYVIVITSFIWIPTILLQLIAELLVIKKNPRTENIGQLLVVESGILCLSLIVIFHDMETQTITYSLLALLISQLLRWIYITKKGTKTNEL